MSWKPNGMYVADDPKGDGQAAINPTEAGIQLGVMTSKGTFPAWVVLDPEAARGFALALLKVVDKA